jgi:signal transduction histidine kinase
MRKRSILYDFSFFIFLLAICMLAILAWRVDALQSRITKDSLSTQAEKIEQYFNGRILYTSSILGYMGRQIAQNTKAPGKENLQYINQLFKYFSADPEIQQVLSWTIIGWVDHNFIALVDGKKEILKAPIDLSTRDYLPLTKKNPWQIHLGEPIFGSTSNKYIIPAGVGVTDARQRYLGSLIIGFQVSYLQKLFTSLIDPEHTSVALIENGTHMILVESNDYAISNNSSPEFHENIEQVIRSGKTISRIAPFGIGTSYYLRPISGTKYTLYLVHKQALNWIFFVQLVTEYWKSALLMLFGCLATIFYTQIYVVKPFRSMSLAADKIAQNNFQNIEFPHSPYKEINNLIRALLRNKILKKKDLIRQEILSKALKTTEFAKDEAERISSLKTRFMTQIVHDVVSPLSSALGFTQLLLRGDIEGKLHKNQDDAVLSIKNTMSYVIDVATEMLETAELEMGEKKLKDEVLDIDTMIDEAFSYMEGRAIKSGISLHYQPLQEKLKIISERKYFLRIIINILSNAVKYSPEGSRVCVSTEQENEYFIITIKDEGCGIKNIENIFIPFMNAKILKNHESFGIGLSNVRYMIDELHGGKLEIESQEDVGTKIILKFPIARLVPSC